MNEMENINKIIIHHTERNNDSPSFVKLRHKYLRGWDDIGYHYLIGNTRPFSKNGKVYSGRSEYLEGAHTLGHNTNSLGICIIGNFDTTIPSEEQLETLFEFLLQKMEKYRLTVHDILGHNEMSGTTKTCPGRFVDMSYIRGVLRQEYAFSMPDYIEGFRERDTMIYT